MKLFSVAFIFASIYYFAHCDDNNAKVGAQKAQWQKYKVVEWKFNVPFFVKNKCFFDISGRV